MWKHIATDAASASISLGNSMPPAAVTKVATQDKVSATDYKFSLSFGQSSAFVLTLPKYNKNISKMKHTKHLFLLIAVLAFLLLALLYNY